MAEKMFKPFQGYNVYEDGEIYSNKSNRFLKPEITKFGYKQVSLSINGVMKRYRVHRLVALLFLDVPENYEELVVNHKDGNKLNNSYTNLEWCTYDYNNYHARVTGLNNVSKSNSDRQNDPEFRKRTSEKLSRTILENGSSKGEKNGRFRYRIYDTHGNLYSREELSELLSLSQSRTDYFIKQGANGVSNKYFDKFGIYIKDIKSKVNRLSKATDNEKNVAL